MAAYYLDSCFNLANAKSISGKLVYLSVNQVNDTKLVRRLKRIYEMVYAAEEWERRHGTVKLTNLILGTLDGKYDNQFKSAPKGWDDEWKWQPR